MAAGGLPVERLRDYLRELPAGARALLIAELERASLRGDDIPGGHVLLHELRSAVRQSGQGVPRASDPARLCFRPLDPFLVDDTSPHKYKWRMSRATLEPIWQWISRDVVPAEAKTFQSEVSRALAAGDHATCDQLTSAFQDQLVERLRSTLAATESNEKAVRRLAGQIGTPQALDDVRDLLAILANRDALALIGRRLPGHIANFTDTQTASTKVLLDPPLGLPRELLPYSLVLVMSRLAAPWQLIRLAVKAAESDHDARIAGTPYAAAVTLVLTEVERMVGELKDDLKRGAAAAGIALVKSIHDAVRGLRSELDLAGDSPWGRQLAAIRSQSSDVLRTEIESVPGRLRRLLRLRPVGEIARGSSLNTDDVADTEALIVLFGACRNYASELAINESTLRIYHEVEQYLDTGTPALLDSLRSAKAADRSFRQSQVDAAVRFCGRVFGTEYASLLTKAAEVAANSERKAAAKA